GDSTSTENTVGQRWRRPLQPLVDSDGRRGSHRHTRRPTAAEDHIRRLAIFQVRTANAGPSSATHLTTNPYFDAEQLQLALSQLQLSATLGVAVDGRLVLAPRCGNMMAGPAMHPRCP